MMVRGFSYSLFLHSILLLLIGIGIPMFFDRDKEFMPVAISVELVPIKEISNLPKTQRPVKKTESKPKPVERPKPPKPPKPVVKETLPEPKPEPVKVTKPEVKKDTPPSKPTKKPEVKKPAKDKPDEFEQLLKDLTEQQDSTEKPEKERTENSAKSKSDRYDPTIPLSISEKDAVRSQFAKHWRLPAGVRDDYTLKVEIRILVNPDGRIKQSGIVKHQASRYRSDPAFRAAADSALRAVQLASPLKNLPQDKYSTWKDMVVNFDPREMLY